MIDTHSHIIFDVDDGASTIEESIAMIKKMKEAGYDSIIATPHYIEDNYNVDNRTKKQKLKLITEKLEESNIDIKLYLGNEIFIQDDILKKIRKCEISTLNNTSYLLVELPLEEKLNLDLEIIYDLVANGAKVILAHPERYKIFHKDFKELEKYLELGVLLQGNIDSLSGKYGKQSKKLFVKLLKKREYFVLGSDIHTGKSNFYNRVSFLREEAIKLTDENYINDLMVSNPQKIINDVEI